MQHSNRVLVLRVGALHVVVIYLFNNHAENGIFTGLLYVEMAFVNTSIMFNRTARKVTTAARCFPPLGDATFLGSLPSELKLYWLWQRNWKKKKVAKPLVIPQHTDLAHSYRIYQIRNAQLSCVCACQLVEAFPSAVADPDLQITKGGGGGRSSRPLR